MKENTPPSNSKSKDTGSLLGVGVSLVRSLLGEPASTHSGTHPSRFLPQVVIENVAPQLQGGRYPIKRAVGEAIEVGADIFKDGHDLIGARVLYRRSGERTFREAPLHFDYNEDRWSGVFRVDAVGRWEYCVEAWTDHFGTWKAFLHKRIAAGQDLSVELVDGARLLETRAESLPEAERERARRAAATLADGKLSQAERCQVALAAELEASLFGPHRPSDAARSPVLECVVDLPRAAFASWYELFPRSASPHPGVHGTFDDVAGRIPELQALGFDVLYLPPIHPIGKIHRKGRNNNPTCQEGDLGSPWAIGSDEGGHESFHPQLGNEESFRRLVEAARAANIDLALDFALQCAPDHPWVKSHPDWFHVRSDGSIRYAENPPKKYQDIYPINFWCEDRENLWNACRDALLYWVSLGVRIFRVDNPHTKPLAFWEWAIAQVKAKHPEVTFLAEAFTRPKRMRSLAALGFSQSYTYYTWKTSSDELRSYVEELTQSEMAEYYRPNFFANTPDILHEFLQHGGRAAFRLRLLLAGTLSPIYGIYSGYELCEGVPVHPGSEEYLDSEKYEIRQRDYHAPGNILPDVQLLNRLRRENPALQQLRNLKFAGSSNPHVIAYTKTAPGNDLIIVVNLDPHHAQAATIHLPLHQLGLADGQPFLVEDLLTGERYTWSGANNYVALDPARHVGHLLRIVR